MYTQERLKHWKQKCLRIKIEINEFLRIWEKHEDQEFQIKEIKSCKKYKYQRKIRQRH